MKHPIKAVIFDFDGTISDTIPAIREGVNLTMQSYGYPQHTDADIRRFINNGPRLLIQRAMPEGLREDASLLDRVLADYNVFYRSVCLHTNSTYAGIPELIAQLHKTYRIGVLSNKQDEFVKALCRQVLPEGCVDAALGALAGHPTKPDPYLSLRIAAELGVAPAECVMIGDSDVDILTAKNAGMQHIGVSWGYRSADFLAAHGALRIANVPAEIKELLK